MEREARDAVDLGGKGTLKKLIKLRRGQTGRRKEEKKLPGAERAPKQLKLERISSPPVGDVRTNFGGDKILPSQARWLPVMR